MHIMLRRDGRFTEMRDHCPDQYHEEGSLCGQRLSFFFFFNPQADG